jgi:hypothetical protein
MNEHVLVDKIPLVVRYCRHKRFRRVAAFKNLFIIERRDMNPNRALTFPMAISLPQEEVT